MVLTEKKICGIILYDVEPRVLRIYNEEICRVKGTVTTRHKYRHKELEMNVAQRKFSVMIKNGNLIKKEGKILVYKYGKYIFYIDNVVNNIFFIKFSNRCHIPSEVADATSIDYQKIGLNKSGTKMNTCAIGY